jgi:hypothetical protein
MDAGTAAAHDQRAHDRMDKREDADQQHRGDDQCQRHARVVLGGRARITAGPSSVGEKP